MELANILAVDDDVDLLRIIDHALTNQGHRVVTYESCSKIQINELHQYDLILLDIMIPEVNGLEFCRKIRKHVDCPILFITSKSEESEMIEGLDVGADDYILKPFSIAGLRARVDAHLRRETREKNNGFSLGAVRFNMSAKELYVKSHKIAVTKSEYEICKFLALNHGQTFSKTAIFEKVFGFDRDSYDTVVVEHIKNIRQKLSKVGNHSIKTVWGIGYRWEKEE